MSLRICLVSPFAWSQPHDVNEHVAGVAAGLRELGYHVTILAPSTRASDLVAGRRALLDGGNTDVIALGPAVPVSRRSRVGVPVGVRANLALALAAGRYDVVHGFEAGLPSLSYLALRDAQALTVATFLSAERLGYPPGRMQRERLLARLDALAATSAETAEAAALRFPGEYTVVSPGVDLDLFRPGEKRRLAVLEWRPAERALARAVIRVLRELPDWELVLLRTKPLSGRPYRPPSLRDRIHVRTARDGRSRAQIFREASIVVPALTGLPRVRLEAAAAGAAIAAPPGMREQPELAAAALARLAEDEEHRAGTAAKNRAEAETQSFAAVASELDALYRRLARRRRPRPAADPLGERDWILCDLHTHTSWSHDCRIGVAELLDHAELEGLGAIAVTDHNVFGGAQEAVELARTRDLVVIPGEEMKTAGQGEVIGLFLSEEIPRGLTFEETIAAIRAQGGLVYLPHPFDRLHAIPDAPTLQRHLADIDVFEVYNARLLFEAYNEEALRFATKYNLTMGAGSDAHVLQGLGTGALRMRAFDGPEEFLVSLRTAQVLRRPKSLVYLQSLKWVAQAKERVR
ncbi:MAG TPA: glycosyltransferase [Gaiellaceae bacterium]|jgi:predicted metal-dependent phosphoesterase TrpH/glycosyltransferase involved in cell wall biosynthesis|nr:glycosyltransferase [Gaiellaceae bacterium]